jgi:hypothetical protein
MNYDWEQAFIAVEDVLENPTQKLKDKTDKMNDLLNNIVPYFRCSDEDIVKIYYYLWSLHLMYYTQGDRGMQVQPHTQTAVKNWVSGVFGSNAIAHVIGAWQIYEHSGNKTFLAQAYHFYTKLFWDGIGGNILGMHMMRYYV